MTNSPCLSCCGSFKNVCLGHCGDCVECGTPCGASVEVPSVRREGVRGAVIEYEHTMLRIVAQKNMYNVMALKELHSAAKIIESVAKRMPKPIIDKIFSFAYGDRDEYVVEYTIMVVLKTLDNGGFVQGNWQFQCLLDAEAGVAYTENAREIDDSFFCGGYLRVDGVVNALWPNTAVKRSLRYLAM